MRTWWFCMLEQRWKNNTTVSRFHSLGIYRVYPTLYNADLDCKRLIWNDGRLTGSGRVTCVNSRTIVKRSKSTFDVLSMVFVACFRHNTHHTFTFKRNMLKWTSFIWRECSLLLYQNGVCVDIYRDSDRNTPETLTSGACVMQNVHQWYQKPQRDASMWHSTSETTFIWRNSDLQWSGH